MGIEVKIEIKWDVIANMVVSAMESGDPVTRGWCGGIGPTIKGEALARFRGPWYATPAYFEAGHGLAVDEIIDERSGKTVRRTVTTNDVRNALVRMATQNPGHFASILEDDTDAATADIFLQQAALGEVRYG